MHSKEKTHYQGASSLYIGSEPSMKPTKENPDDYALKKNQGLIESLIITAE